MQSDRQQRITERAYQIWVAEGRVHGKDHEHWQRAERQIAEEELRVAAALAKRATGSAGTTKARRPRQAAGAKKPGTKAAAKSSATPAAPARRGVRHTPGGSSSS
jgi:hypothetical protein